MNHKGFLGKGPGNEDVTAGNRSSGFIFLIWLSPLISNDSLNKREVTPFLWFPLN